MNSIKPRFSIGQKVTHKKNLYGETEGVIVEYHRRFAAIDHKGNFIYNGLQIDSNSTDDIVTINYTDGTSASYKFFGYTCVVESPNMQTSFPETALKLKK